MYYVLTDLPNGIKAIVTIGIVAAALSTLNSGLNSMSSVAVQDIYRGLMKNRGKTISEHDMVKAGRISMIAVAVCLSAMAALCYYWQLHTVMTFLAFALSVMVFSYSGLLGVYFTALFSRRGSPSSILFSLIVGFSIPVLLQPGVMALYLADEYQFSLGFSWQLVIATFVATCVCLMGKSNTMTSGFNTLDNKSN
jgi:Na+/proline symporter